MGPLGKRIIVFSMIWIFLVMIVMQVYDNVSGRNMPQASETPVADQTVQPDPDVQHLADLQSCVASNPNDVQCTEDLATLYYSAQQWPQAQVNYERAIKLDPHNVEVLVKLAGTYIYQLKFDQAIQTLQQAASLQPNSPDIHLLLGLSLSKANPPRMTEAVAEWRKVVALSPGSALAEQAQEYINENSP